MSTIIHKGYKANMTIDMINACLEFWKVRNRPVEEIMLRPDKWAEFKRGMLERKPEWEADLEHFKEVSFKNVTIKKGSEFMDKALMEKLRVLVYDDEHIEMVKQQQQDTDLG
jgi:hypothetical protein